MFSRLRLANTLLKRGSSKCPKKTQSSSYKFYSNYEHQYRFYSTNNEEQPRPPPRNQSFLTYLYNKDNFKIPNLVLATMGITILSGSLISNLFYLYEDSTAQSRENYLSRILNYFWWSPPFGVWKNLKTIDFLIEQYKNDELSPEGKKIMIEILHYENGLKLLESDKYDLFNVSLERCLNKKIDSLYQVNHDLDLIILLKIAQHKQINLPEEILSKVPELRSLLTFDKEKSSLIQELKRIQDISMTDMLFAVTSGILVSGFLSKWRRVAMVNSGIACGAFISLRPFQKLWEEKRLNSSKTMREFVFNTTGGATICSLALISASTLPHITWMIPCTVLLAGKKTLEFVTVINDAKSQLSVKLPQMDLQNPQQTSNDIKQK